MRCLSPEWALGSIIGNEKRGSDRFPLARPYSLGARVLFSILTNSTSNDSRKWHSTVAYSEVTVTHD